MGELRVKDKEVVVPGEILAQGMDYLPGQGTYRLGDDIRAEQLGLVSIDGRAVKLINLSGRYAPKIGDVIIGKVIDVSFSGWRIDTNCAYSAMLSVKDATTDYIVRGANLTEYLDLGDYVCVKVTNVTSQKLVDVTMKGFGLRKLEGGRIITVASSKVPRIIGKAASMVSMIKAATGCKIAVGQNGIIWVSGPLERENYAVAVIKKIEAHSHISGLTETIKAELEQKFGPIPELPPEEEHQPQPFDHERRRFERPMEGHGPRRFNNYGRHDRGTRDNPRRGRFYSE